MYIARDGRDRRAGAGAGLRDRAGDDRAIRGACRWARPIPSCSASPIRAAAARMRLASADPNAAPLIDPNYLAEEYDRDAYLEALEQARAVGAARGAGRLARGRVSARPERSDHRREARVPGAGGLHPSSSGRHLPHGTNDETRWSAGSQAARPRRALRLRRLDHALRSPPGRSMPPSSRSPNASATCCAAARRLRRICRHARPWCRGAHEHRDSSMLLPVRRAAVVVRIGCAGPAGHFVAGQRGNGAAALPLDVRPLGRPRSRCAGAGRRDRSWR